MLKTPAHFTSLIKPHRHPHQHPLPATFLFSGDSLLVRAATLALPSDFDLAAIGWGSESNSYGPDSPAHAVGLLGEQYCQTAWVPPKRWSQAELDAKGLVFKKLRSLFGVMDEATLSVAGRAFQIAEWSRTHRFCGACGGATTHVSGERCAKCAACGHQAYPRISPAMMVLVRRGDAILLARHSASPTGFFTALAGFLEAGESVEDAIHREVFEEVGLKVRNIAYFGSQPWPFPHSLMMAYTAEFEAGDILVDATEIAEARWFGPHDDLPPIPHGISIASDLIRAHLPRATA